MVVTTNAVDDPSIENIVEQLCTNECELPEEDHCAHHLG